MFSCVKLKQVVIQVRLGVLDHKDQGVVQSICCKFEPLNETVSRYLFCEGTSVLNVELDFVLSSSVLNSFLFSSLSAQRDSR